MPAMSLFKNSVRIVALVSILLSSTAAQSCYYPDGSESNHVACSSSGSEASCCDASQICLDNGLCFGAGIMSRGSCTDKDWNSKECSQHCGEVSRNSSIPVIACTNGGQESKFMCGMNSTNCRRTSTLFTLSTGAITLRPSELEALVKPAVSSALAQTTTQAAVITKVTVTAAATANPNAIYSPGDMAGLGVGLGIPLLIASCLALMLWRRDRARTPKLMYPLPDDLIDPYTSIDGRPLHPTMGASLRPPASRDGSIMTSNSSNTATPGPMHTFAERYQVMKGAHGLQIQRVELDASPIGDFDADEHELHDLKVPLPKEF